MTRRALTILAVAAMAGALVQCTGERAISIAFRPAWGTAALSCVPDANEVALTDLRFFVHDVALLKANGDVVPVHLDVAPPWQSSDVALIDLEDGKGNCDTGSPMVHDSIQGRVRAGDYVGLRFTLGVPFAHNHADPAKAAPPLDQMVMHWNWQGGYKFLRTGLQAKDRKASLHLGSTGCEGKIGAISACAQPNRVVVTLPRFDANTDTVAVDLEALFASALPAGGAAMCQSETDNPVCEPLMRRLGLGTGAPQQDVFRRAARP